MWLRVKEPTVDEQFGTCGSSDVHFLEVDAQYP